MLCNRTQGTFKGTVQELHGLAQKHQGTIAFWPMAKVNSTTYVLVNQHGQVFKILGNDKYERVGTCSGGSYA